MNFFEAQDEARRRTGLLVVLMLLAVLVLVALTDLLVTAAWVYLQRNGQLSWAAIEAGLFGPLLPWVASGVTLAIAGASLWKWLQFTANGGSSIAWALGALSLDPRTQDPDERRLINVVEEIAIASGVAVPALYVMEEHSINAFAAGHGPDDAVIAVTRGALRQLTRDQLQGIVAHEFSHVMHGDARLNIHLIAILHGILFIGLAGKALVRAGLGGGRRRDRDERGGGAWQLAVLGIALMVIGGIGSFFGRLIRAAVCRQREFLADASAVRFTRNPDGIAGALRRIGGGPRRARLDAPRAAEASHLFFADALGQSLFGMLATHPPLEQRVRAIDPRWDGTWIAPPAAGAAGSASTISTPPASSALARTGPAPVDAAMYAAGPADAAPSGNASAGTLATASGAGPGTGALAGTGRANGEPAGASPGSPPGSPLATTAGPAGGATGGPAPLPPAIDELLRRIGDPREADLRAARTLLDALPAAVHAAVHDADLAAAIVLGILDPQQADPAWPDWLARGDGARRAEIRALATTVASLDPLWHLPLVHLGAPALVRMPADRQEAFRATMKRIIRSDQAIALHEWVIHQVLRAHLAAHHGHARPPAARYRRCDLLPVACGTLMAALARAAGDDATLQQRAWAAGMAELGIRNATPDLSPDLHFSRLNDALRQLRHLYPLAKPRLLKAAAACVLADRTLQRDERDLLQGIAAALDCPMPRLEDS